MLTANFYWSLVGILISVVSGLILLNDLKNCRVYVVVGGQGSFEKKVTIRRDRSPLLFKVIVTVIALCSAFMLVTCLLLLVREVTSIDLLGTTDFRKLVAAFIPYGLVIMYVLDGLSVRLFAKSWDMETEGLQTLGLSTGKKKDDASS